MFGKQKKKAGCISYLLGIVLWIVVLLIILPNGKEKTETPTETAAPTAAVTATATAAPTVVPVLYDDTDPIASVLANANNNNFVFSSYDLQSDVLMIQVQSANGKMSYLPGMAVLYAAKSIENAFSSSGAPMLYYEFREDGRTTITMRITKETASHIDFEAFLIEYGFVDESSIRLFLEMIDGYSIIGEYKPLLV